MDSLGMEAFLAIAKTRNLTKAAELLHLSQSTVSHRLQALERSVGATLVERGKGRPNVELTAFGGSFVAIAERWNLLNREIAVMKTDGLRLRLAVGVVDSLNLYVLPPLYRLIMRQFPGLSLKILTRHTVESYDGIERRELDLAFVNTEKVSVNVLVEPLCADEMLLVRPAGAAESAAAAVSPLTLDAKHELYFNWGPAYQLWRERWWDGNIPARLQVDAAALIFFLMQDNRQWAIVPRSIVNAFARPGRHVVQPLTEPPPARICYRLRHKHQEPGQAAVLAEIDQLAKRLYRGGKIPARDGEEGNGQAEPNNP